MWGDDGGSYLPPGSGVYQCHARRLKKEERVICGKEGNREWSWLSQTSASEQPNVTTQSFFLLWQIILTNNLTNTTLHIRCINMSLGGEIHSM